jgi:hypothetical protein
MLVPRLCGLLKNPAGMKEILRSQNSWPFLAKYILLLYQMSVLVIARELW